MKRLIACLAAASLSAWAQNAGDPAMLAKIRAEAENHSQVQALFEMLTVNIGPRLTASPAHKRAVEYTRGRLEAFGLSNVRVEPWHFGRGWELQKLTVEMVKPRYVPLIGYADGWSAATGGEILGAPVWVGGNTPEQIADLKPRLKGSIVMTDPIMTNFVVKDRPQPSAADYVPGSAAYATSLSSGRGGRGAPTRAQQVTDILREAGAGLILKPSRGEHGTVFVTGRDGGSGAVPSVTLSAEHYNMIARMLERNIPVELRVNLESKFYDSDNGNAWNVLAELPGSDPALRDEVVMIGGHLDSWHTGVGATDNADGATTVIEAMRILKAVGARPRRTIRVALWGGEEQGLLGSKAWVEQHLAGDANSDARKKLDVYFNIDNGTGPIYGWYLQNVQAAAPLFDAWLAPLRSVGARRNIIEPVGSTDHLSFTSVGVPGFNPIQDYVDYDVRTHHTNEDTIERVDVNQIRQAATVMAWFAWNAAAIDGRIPGPAK